MRTLQVEFCNGRKERNGILRGVVTLPSGEDPFPVVVNLHGFGGTRGGYKSMHVSMARALAQVGVGCVRFDFYGNGESDGEFEEMTFTSLLEDTEDIWRWTEKQEWADSEKMILSGQSMGGFVASTAAPRLARTSSEITAAAPKALILMCPGAGMWYGCAERSRAMEAQGIAYGDIEGLKFSHQFNYDLGANYNPFRDAAGYDGPVLLLRGTEDNLVDEKTCMEYMKLYSKESRFIQIEGGNHNFAKIPVREKLNHEICKFCTEVLGAENE